MISNFEVALDALYGPIYYRLLVPIGPLDITWIRALIAHVMNGLLANESTANHFARRPPSFQEGK